MTSCADVMGCVFAALQAVEEDGPIVRPGDLPTLQYPRRKLRYVVETKQSQGRGSIGFTTLVTIRVIHEVSEPAPVDDDILISEIDAKLEAAKQRSERAIINSSPLFGIVQQLVSVQSQMAYDAQATHLAGLQQDYTFEFFESADDFAPLETDDLTEIRVTDPSHPPVAFGINY